MHVIARTTARTAAFALAILSAAPLAAQNPQIEESVRRIFTSRDYSSQFFGPARWLEGGDAYTTLEPSTEVADAQDIVRYQTATGARTVHVSARRLVPAGDSAALAVEDYRWSDDGAKLLVFTNTQRVWRDNTRGDYWVLDLRSGALRKLGGPDAPESTLMFAKFSPAGDRVAYVRQGDLYVERLADGRVTRLTSDGSRTLVNGTTDWVYEEEFFLRDAFRWSPDGRRIAFWQFDMSGVRDFSLINNTDSLYSFVIPVQYPKAGTTNSAVRAGVIDAEGGPTRWLDLPGDPRNDYLPRMEWTTDSRELVLQRLNRLQNTNRVMLGDAASGAARTILTERDSAWLDVVDDFRWLAGGREFLWVSERDGWRHLYAGRRDGGEPRLLTPGAYDVVGVEVVDEPGGWIYFTASPSNPTQRYLYRVPLAGGPAVRLSPANAPGTHGYDVSPNGRWAFHTFSTFDTPNASDLVSLPAHTVVRPLAENRALRAAVAPLVHRPTEFFRVPVGGGVELDGWMIFPRDFDPAKRYPLLMYVYTEPWGQTAVDAWGGRSALWHRMLADLGYVVATVDNRGTPSPRGRAWRKVVYGAVGELSSREQADAVRVLTRARPYLDPTRVGVWGWSGGGSATLNAMFRYPDVYQVGMSVAPVPDQHLYDTVYQERYTGIPQDNPDGYRRGSPISFAEGLRGDLLLVHGSGDDNVHYQGTQRLMNRLVELGKSFDMMEYPNRSHCICEGRGTTVHVYSLLTRYLVEHLPAGGR
ncbi:MAG TPA: S9 family peptidase [Longimicrobiaceae bacterium]|nr:S9 family peptidase [Longimicrobiaceae bacterium]